MKKLALLFALVLAFAALPAQAQYVEKFITGEQAGGSVADDTSIALLTKCTAPGSDFTVAVAADGNLTYQQDSAAYDGFECPVSGALGGIIDVSDADCDTLAEVIDIINADSNGYCKAVILDGLDSDSSDNTLLVLTTADVGDGESLEWDTSVALHQTRALTAKRDIDDYLLGPDIPRLIEKPFRSWRTVWHWGSFTSTYGSGTSAITMVSVDMTNLAGGSSEVATTLYTEAGGATTAAEVEDLMPYGIPALAHEKVIIRLTNSAAMASTTFVVNGIEFSFP